MILMPAVLALYTTQEEVVHVTALFEAYHMTMYYECREILSSHEDAEDAVQEAFIIIHDHLWKLEDIKCNRTRSFVVLVAKNIAKNMIRKRRRMNAFSLDEMPSELPDEGEEVFTQIEVKEILSEINNLPETAREILLLKFLHQCTDKELAAIMGIRHDAVRKRVERARALLIVRLINQS